MSARVAADVPRSALRRADGLRVEAHLQPMGVWTVAATVPARDDQQPIQLLDFCFQPPWFQECVCVAQPDGAAANLLFTGQYSDRYYSAVCTLDDSGLHWEVCERARGHLKADEVSWRLRRSPQTNVEISKEGLLLKLDDAPDGFRRWRLTSSDKNLAFTIDGTGVAAGRLMAEAAAGAQAVQYGLHLNTI